MKKLNMASALSRIREALYLQGNKLLNIFYFRYPPENFLPALVIGPHEVQNNYNVKSLTELLKDSMLWAVPKKRRSIEKRRCRRFGIPSLYYKMLVPKTNILVCPKCGSYREAGLLCPTCYARVTQETKEMQTAIEENLGIAPAENEVVLLYKDDERLDPEFYNGKRIVEMNKERPKLFSNNLLQKSTQTVSDSKEIITKE